MKMQIKCKILNVNIHNKLQIGMIKMSNTKKRGIN